MDLVQVLSALGSVSVVVGIVLGLLQLRAIARQPQEDMVLRAVEPFLDPALSRAFWEVSRGDSRPSSSSMPRPRSTIG